MISAAGIYAKTYISEAPAGGFNIDGGKDYVVLYAPDDVVAKMGSKLVSDNNLDKNQVKNYLEYWVTDWDPKDLTLYDVPPAEGEVNSFGTADFINATPLYAWGTGVFIAKSTPYDLSKVTDEHHLHIGLRDFGSKPSKYQFSLGSQKTIKTNGFQIMAGIGLGETSGDFVGVGELAGGNDGKWYYLDIPVKDLVDPNGEFGFEYDFSKPIADGAFAFTFNTPECSTATKSGPAPGNTVYDYQITKLGSALSLDHIFLYVPVAGASVDRLEADGADTEVVYYDLMGRKVQNPTSGLYIAKSSAGARKVLIK